MSVSCREIASMFNTDDLGCHQATVETPWPTVPDRCLQNLRSDVMILFSFALAIIRSSAVALERLDS